MRRGRSWDHSNQSLELSDVLSILLTSMWTPSGSTSVQGPWEHNTVIRPKTSVINLPAEQKGVCNGLEKRRWGRKLESDSKK